MSVTYRAPNGDVVTVPGELVTDQRAPAPDRREGLEWAALVELAAVYRPTGRPDGNDRERLAILCEKVAALAAASTPQADLVTNYREQPNEALRPSYHFPGVGDRLAAASTPQAVDVVPRADYDDLVEVARTVVNHYDGRNQFQPLLTRKDIDALRALIDPATPEPKDWYDRDAEAFARARKQSAATPEPVRGRPSGIVMTPAGPNVSVEFATPEPVEGEPK